MDLQKSPMKNQLTRDTTWRILVQLKRTENDGQHLFRRMKRAKPREIKAMLVDIQMSLSSIMLENKRSTELGRLTASLQLSENELRHMKTKLDNAKQS